MFVAPVHADRDGATKAARGTRRLSLSGSGRAIVAAGESAGPGVSAHRDDGSTPPGASATTDRTYGIPPAKLSLSVGASLVAGP